MQEERQAGLDVPGRHGGQSRGQQARGGAAAGCSACSASTAQQCEALMCCLSAPITLQPCLMPLAQTSVLRSPVTLSSAEYTLSDNYETTEEAPGCSAGREGGEAANFLR